MTKGKISSRALNIWRTLEVEFAGRDGRAYALLPVAVEKLRRLKDTPESVLVSLANFGMSSPVSKFKTTMPKPVTQQENQEAHDWSRFSAEQLAGQYAPTEGVYDEDGWPRRWHAHFFSGWGL